MGFERYLPYLYDIIAVVVILSAIYHASRVGLVRSLISFVGALLSLAVASVASKVAASYVFQSFLRGGLLEKVQQALQDTAEGLPLVDSLAQALEELPAYLRGMLSLAGIGVDQITGDLSGYTGDAAVVIVDDVLAPAATAILSILFFLVLFSVLMFLCRLISRSFRGLHRVPIIGPVDSLLGGVLGLAQGVIYVWLLYLVLSLVAAVTNGSIGFLSSEVLRGAYSYQLFLQHSPVDLLAGLV